jgi:hypothetical protein
MRPNEVLKKPPASIDSLQSGTRAVVGIDLGKRARKMAIITRSGKFKVNRQGNAEPLVTDGPDSHLPAVAVPSGAEMERWKLMSSYRWERKARTQGINQRREGRTIDKLSSI